MAAIFSAAVNKLGRTIFRKAGRFVSEQTYKRGTSALARSGAANVSRQLTRGERQQNKTLAQHVMDQVGPPIGGGNWVSRTRQSASRFEEMLGDNNELG